MNPQAVTTCAPAVGVAVGQYQCSDGGVIAAPAAPQTLWAMQQSPRWLLWRLVPVPNAKPRKIPHYANGLTRGETDTANDTAQLVSYDVAVAAYHAHQGRYHGLGFALGFDGYAHWQGIDLDNVPHNCLSRFANEVAGYVELSPSETGCHAIGYGRAFNNLASNKSGIEAYCCKRFFTFTGCAIRHAPITCLAEYVEQVLTPHHGGGKRTGSSHSGSDAIPSDQPQVKTDAEVWAAIERADNFETIKALCNKPATDANSNLDASLMQHLVFHTPNNEQAVRMFMVTPLAQRDKVQKRKDYIWRTLTAARNIRDNEIAVLAKAGEGFIALMQVKQQAANEAAAAKQTARDALAQQMAKFEANNPLKKF